MFKKYKMGFNLGGLILFLFIMLPNFYWFVVPAPNDILRAESITGSLDMIASVFQILIVIMLCTVINKNKTKNKFSIFIFATVTCCILYYIGWIFYYKGITNTGIILNLCISPCLAFLFWVLHKKNIVALIPIAIFTICHLIYGIVNFII